MANDIDFKKLGHTIRFLRQGKGWTLTDLAGKSGLSKAYLSDLENGLAGKPNIQYVFAVARALDTTLDRLLRDAAPPLRAPKAESNSDLPPGLAELKKEMGLSDEDTEILATVNFRGNRPRDKEGWRYLLETLRMLSQRRPAR
jgi:transcriptional regulator with XRE-family HTH domain